MQFGTFIKDLAERAGVDTTDKSFVDLLSIQATVPDGIGEKIQQNLFNIDAAKQNPQLKGYFHAQALSVPDRAIQEVLQDLQFDDAVLNEFKEEKSTPAKVKKLAEKIQAKNKALIEELEKKSGSKDSQERISKLAEEIKTLNAQLGEKDKTWEAKVKEVEAREAEKSASFAKKMILAAKEYADDKKPKDLNIEFADLVLQKELAAKKAKAIFNQDGTFKLVQAENPDLEYMENHKPVSFGDFVDRTLANHNMLKVSAPAKTENAPQIKPPHADNSAITQKIVNTYDEQLKVFANGTH